MAVDVAERLDGGRQDDAAGVIDLEGGGGTEQQMRLVEAGAVGGGAKARLVLGRQFGGIAAVIGEQAIGAAMPGGDEQILGARTVLG